MSRAHAIGHAPTRRWVKVAARAGFVAKSIVYVAVGTVAARAAAGWGGQPTDSPGAIITIGRQPAGAFVAAFIGAGLLSYAGWHFLDAVADVRHRGRGFKAVVDRIGAFVTGIAHLALAFTAFAIAVGLQASTPEAMPTWTGRVLRLPAGPWVVGAAGLVVVGVGIGQLVRAVRAGFEQELETRRMSATLQRLARHLGRFGILARMVTFEIVGLFLVRAALDLDPAEVRDLSGALLYLQGQPYGAFLLGMVAIGFVSYGLYAVVEARYREIPA